MKNQKKLKLIIYFNIYNYLRQDLGLVGCDWAWGVGLKCWRVVLGLGGLVWGLREGGVGLGCDGFWDMVLGGYGGTGWVRRLVGWVLGAGVLYWGMGGYVWGLEGCFGFGRGGFGWFWDCAGWI